MTSPPTQLWDVSAELRPLAGGARNRVFRTVGLPVDLVFKSTERSATAIEWLGAVHGFAEAAGFTVPRLRPSSRGLLVEDGWTCEPYLRGNPFSASDMQRLTPRVAEFQRLTQHVAQRPEFSSSQDLLTDTVGGDIDLTAMPNHLVDACRTAWAACSDWKVAIVHGDLTTSNVILCEDGQPALFDWDECRRDLTLFDMAPVAEVPPDAQRACLGWEVACCWRREPARARKLAEQLLAR